MLANRSHVPSLPVTAVVNCAETAANCALDATTAANVTECANTLASCAANVAAPVLTCQQKWTACLAQNLFNFLQCDAQLATCK
jgi:hypothetical protein